MDDLSLMAHAIVSDFMSNQGHGDPVRLKRAIFEVLLAERRRAAGIADMHTPARHVGERGTAAVEILDACDKGPLECGGSCALPKRHDGPCRCGGDDGDGCPA